MDISLVNFVFGIFQENLNKYQLVSVTTKKLLAQTKLLGIIQNQEANALWSNTIIAADAKEFDVIMQSSLYSQIKCLNLDEMNALQPVQSIEENRKLIFLDNFYHQHFINFAAQIAGNEI